MRYHVQMIPQQTVGGCWAASIAMIFGWAQRVSIDPGMIAARDGYQRYLASGLPPNDDKILRDWGIVPEPPMSFSVTGFMQLIHNYGPLWVAGWVPGAHIRVVTGFDPNREPNKAIMYFNDPWEPGMTEFRLPNKGGKYAMNYTQYTQQQESLAKQELGNEAYSKKVPVYVAHLARKPHSD